MRDKHEPDETAAFLAAFRPDQAAHDYYWDNPGEPGTEPGAARAEGLRRLSRLTWRATQLSALTAVGFATLFAHNAPAQTAGSTAPPPSAKASSPAASPASSTSAHPRKTHAAARRHRRVSSAPVATQPAQPAPSPTLTPPTKKPTPPPPTPTPHPTPTTSSTSHHGGG